MWELDCEEGWAPKNWCFWPAVLEKTLEGPLDCKEIQLVHSKGDQTWVFFGRNDAKAETPVLWLLHVKSWLIGKDSDAGRDWGQEEKGTMEDEMTGWHHWLNGHEFGWTLGVGDGLGGLACWDSWGHRVGHNWATELMSHFCRPRGFRKMVSFKFLRYFNLNVPILRQHPTPSQTGSLLCTAELLALRILWFS